MLSHTHQIHDNQSMFPAFAAACQGQFVVQSLIYHCHDTYDNLKTPQQLLSHSQGREMNVNNTAVVAYSYPLHVLHITFLLYSTNLVAPLYNSSRVTLVEKVTKFSRKTHKLFLTLEEFRQTLPCGAVQSLLQTVHHQRTKRTNFHHHQRKRLKITPQVDNTKFVSSTWESSSSTAILYSLNTIVIVNFSLVSI